MAFEKPELIPTQAAGAAAGEEGGCDDAAGLLDEGGDGGEGGIAGETHRYARGFASGLRLEGLGFEGFGRLLQRQSRRCGVTAGDLSLSLSLASARSPTHT